MRDVRIDLLRSLGLFLIILAHVQPPLLVANIRNFDVPLMVLLSGMSFALSYRQEAYGAYVWKRLKRLLFPVWLFLSGYFVYKTFIAGGAFDSSLILPSYFLLHANSIGYVWIIRVFLLVALIAPLLWLLSQKIRSDLQFLLITAAAFAVYELLRYSLRGYLYSGVTGRMADIVFYLVPYALLFALGLRFTSFSKKAHGVLFVLSALVFFGCGLLFWMQEGTYIATQKFKYPPSFYFFSYSMLMLYVLWPMAEKLWAAVSVLHLDKVLSFVSANSIWIYLWHICWLQMPVAIEHWAVRWLVVTLTAGLTAYVQVSLVKRVCQRCDNPVLSRNLKTLLTG